MKTHISGTHFTPREWGESINLHSKLQGCRHHSDKQQDNGRECQEHTPCNYRESFLAKIRENFPYLWGFRRDPESNQAKGVLAEQWHLLLYLQREVPRDYLANGEVARETVVIDRYEKEPSNLPTSMRSCK